MCLSLSPIRQKFLEWLEFSSRVQLSFSQRKLYKDGTALSGVPLSPRTWVVSILFRRALCGMLRPPGPVFSLCSAGWLLLQASRWVVKLGEPIKLKCHSWKKTPVAKVQYFQNGRGKKYSHENSDFYIPEAKLEHSGSYFCRGIIGSKNESSESVQITVQGKTCAALKSPETPVLGILHSHWGDELGGNCWQFHRLLYECHSLWNMTAGARATFPPS